MTQWNWLVFTAQERIFKKEKCNILTINLSDHNPIVLSFALKNKPSPSDGSINNTWIVQKNFKQLKLILNNVSKKMLLKCLQKYFIWNQRILGTTIKMNNNKNSEEKTSSKYHR